MLRVRTLILFFLVAPIVLSVLACASKPQTGIMVAQWTPPAKSSAPAQKIMIAWESNSHTTGDVTFTLGPGGQRYVGTYVLVEDSVRHVAMQPLYDVWQAGSFDEYGIGGMDPWFEPAWGMSTWVDHYNGRVVAALNGNRGGSARCKFRLTNTEAGMPAGGTGQCQLSNGGQLEVDF